jgi:hypothetical protein
MKWVIPSYRRIDTLREKTLATLRGYGIPPDAIYIFTAPEEYHAYREAFPDTNVICGELGLRNQRNFIARYFEEGEELVCMDDDITDILTLSPDGKLIHLQDFQEMARAAFALCRHSSITLWGVAAVANGFYMKDTISTNLKFCIGCVWGIRNWRDLTLSLDYKEDYERTLKCYERDRKVLRYNGIAAKTKMYAPGGMGKTQKERLDHNVASCTFLIERYPQWVRYNPRREGEILMRRTVPYSGGL